MGIYILQSLEQNRRFSCTSFSIQEQRSAVSSSYLKQSSQWFKRNSYPLQMLTHFVILFVSPDQIKRTLKGIPPPVIEIKEYFNSVIWS
jgi:hypothetical protein